MEREGSEHYVAVNADTAITVYCATCLRILADFANRSTQTQFQADMIAENHWMSFTKDHCVVVWDVKGKKGHYMISEPTFTNIEGDDD